MHTFGLEVWILQGEETIGARIRQRPEHRVALAEKESTSGSKELCDNLGPTSYIGQPTECSHAGEHEIEALDPQRVDSAVHLTLDVRHVRTGLDGQHARSPYCRRRKVESRNASRAEARERHGVGSDVTL